MKKTIAKIMAAAMVLSSVVAPNAEAATLKTENAVIYDADLIKAGSDIELFNEGDSVGTASKTVAISLDADAVKKLAANSKYTAKTGYELVATQAVDKATDETVFYYAGKYYSEGVTDTDKAVSATTAAPKFATKGKTINDPIGGEALTVGKSSSKVAVNGKYDAEYPANLEWVTVGFDSNELIVTIDPTTNAWKNDGGIADKLAAGAEIGFYAVLTSVDGQRVYIPITITMDGVTTVTDNYWNAFVKLKGDNNSYTPIRVHVDYDGASSSISATNLVIKSGTLGTSTSSWANTKVQIYDVNSYDRELLESDYAKGKNLMLDNVYLWTGDVSYYTAWDAWDDTQWLKIDEFTEVNVGKVTDIRSRMFKNGKEKLVHAENVKWIRNGAFRKNKQLKKVVLSDDNSMKKINEKAFYDCKKLTTVKMNIKTLKQVGKSAFGGSTDKKTLRFRLKGNKTQFNNAVKKIKKSGVKKAKFTKI